jgi:two-component system phosphate regulon sensor histidine kinase PhoR
MLTETLAQMNARKPLRVAIAIALGIGLPSAFLAYLSLRSYQSEGRLMQRETQERFAVVADVFEKKIITLFSDIQGSLRSVAEQPGFQHLTMAELIPVLLHPPALDHITPERLFVFDETDAMIAPWPERVAAHQPTAYPKDLSWGAYSGEIKRLERLENAQKDFQSALRGYTALQARELTPTQRAVLLENIAGDYRQLHQYDAAVATYLTLAHQYEQLIDMTGLPMGVLGRQLAIEIHEAKGTWGEAVDLRLELVRGLLHHKWPLSAPQRTELLQQNQDALQHILATHPAISSGRRSGWNELQGQFETLHALEREGEQFAKNDWPMILRRMHTQGPLDKEAIFQLDHAHASRIAVVVPILAPDTGRRRGLCVALLSSESLWSRINDLIQEVGPPAGLDIQWSHPRPGSGDSRRFWQSHLQREVTVIDPPLHFDFIERPSNRDLLLQHRQWIFGAMSAMAFIIIIVGLVFTGLAVKRETEVVNLKADFVASVSHELRTPLSVISHIGEKLTHKHYRTDDERERIYKLLSRETGHLRNLIEDILDFSKIMAGKQVYRSDPIDLGVLTLECVAMIEPKAEARGFVLHSEIPSVAIPIRGDPRALKQAILNLIDNAMKYSGDSRKIALTVSKSGPTAMIAVQDRGIGIAKTDQERIFEKFYRSAQTPKGQDPGGVGLGLAMVKHVIEGHGGKIELKSSVGHGSTFTLIFPLTLGG